MWPSFSPGRTAAFGRGKPCRRPFGPFSVVAADLNGDGRQDAVAASEEWRGLAGDPARACRRVIPCPSAYMVINDPSIMRNRAGYNGASSNPMASNCISSASGRFNSDSSLRSRSMSFLVSCVLDL